MNEDGDGDDEAERRHKLWMVLWTAVGALATAATAVVAFWQLNTSEEPPPSSGGAAESGKSSENPGKNSEQDGKYSAFSGEEVYLKNIHTHFCADLPGFDAGSQSDPVQQWQCITHGDNQLWRLNRDHGAEGSKDRPVFEIINAKSNLCMDLPKFEGRGEGTLVGQHACAETPTADNQLWWLQKVKGGYRIRNLASDNLCLDVRGREVEKHEVPLIIDGCTGNDQAWQIRAVT